MCILRLNAVNRARQWCLDIPCLARPAEQAAATLPSWSFPAVSYGAFRNPTVTLLHSLKGTPPLDLAQLRQILAPVIELGGSRIGMIRHVLRRFERAAIAQKHRHARSPERVITEGLRQPRGYAPGFDHTQHVAPADGFTGKLVRLVERLEERRFPVFDPGSPDVGIQIRLRLVMQPDQLLLISFFKEAEPRALSLQPVIAAHQSHDSTDARKGVAHNGYRGPVTQALDVRNLFIPPVFPRDLDPASNWEEIQEQASLLALHDGRDANLAANFRSLNKQRGVVGNDLLDDEPIEKATQRRQVLFDGRSGQRLGFDISGHMQRSDCVQPQAIFLTPAAKLRGGLDIGGARVFVADSGGKEFKEAFAGFVAGRGDDRRHRKFR